MHIYWFSSESGYRRQQRQRQRQWQRQCQTPKYNHQGDILPITLKKYKNIYKGLWCYTAKLRHLLSINTIEKWWTDLTFLGLVVAILWEEMGKDVATAGSQVDQRTFFTNTQSSRHRHHHTHRLDQQCPFPKVATDHKPTQNGLHLSCQQDSISGVVSSQLTDSC